MIVLTADYGGAICVWETTGLAESIHISELQEITQEYRQTLYFSMGYPYYISAHGNRIAISTDLGVLVVRSNYLRGCSSYQ